MPPNYYHLLGLSYDASADEIRSAYRELARKVHPDANPGDHRAADAFIQLQKAYDVLSDPKARQAFDESLPIAFKTPPANLQVFYSRSSLMAVTDPQLLYALVRIGPSENAVQYNKHPLNVCLAIDCSTSMQGQLLDTVKATSIELVRQMRPEDIFSIVAFSDRAEVVVPAMLSQDRHRVETSIRMLQTSGGTELYQGLDLAYREVQRNRSSKYINHIVLITDGRTYGDEGVSLLLADKAGKEQIGISCLGIGGKWNDSFLDKMASISGGTTMFVNRAKDVQTFLVEKIQHLESNFANMVRLNMHLGEGVELKDAFRLAPDAAPLECQSPILLGPIPKESPLEFIFEFLVSPFSAKNDKICLFKGRLFLEIPGSAEKNSLLLDLERKVHQQTDPLPPPQLIVQAMSTLTLYRIQDRARKAVEEGRITDATRLLQNLATHLFAQGNSEFAATVLREASHLQRTSNFSEVGDKRIKYGTRALLLLPSNMEKNV